MRTFFMTLAGFCLLGYGLLALLGGLDSGGLLIACLLAVGIIAALLACTLEKLDRVEKKLDKLLEEWKGETEDVGE